MCCVAMWLSGFVLCRHDVSRCASLFDVQFPTGFQCFLMSAACDSPLWRSSQAELACWRFLFPFPPRGAAGIRPAGRSVPPSRAAGRGQPMPLPGGRLWEEGLFSPPWSLGATMLRGGRLWRGPAAPQLHLRHEFRSAGAGKKRALCKRCFVTSLAT